MLSEPINKNIFENLSDVAATACQTASIVNSGMSGGGVGGGMTAETSIAALSSSSSAAAAVVGESASEVVAAQRRSRRHQQQENDQNPETTLTAMNSMAKSIGMSGVVASGHQAGVPGGGEQSSSNFSNLSNSLVSSSKHDGKSYSGDQPATSNSNSISSTFVFGFEDKRRVAYMKSVEKDIIEYISRVIINFLFFFKNCFLVESINVRF